MLNIRLLGDFSLTHADQPVGAISTPRLQSLLAYVLLHRDGPLLRQQLAFLFWPDSNEAQARNNLRQLLHELRHGLPEADRFLQIDARTVAWRADAPFRLDVDDFEQALKAARNDEARRSALERAAQIYRADLLRACYDDWIAPLRQRLRQEHRAALARLVDLLEEQRDYAEAIRHAQRLLRDEPTDEESCRRLMKLLALNEDRAGAVRVYQGFAADLERELGLEPTEKTRQAYETLLHTEPAPKQRAQESAPPLIGRQREWERLQAALRSALAGQPGFALISGVAGIGKSRLADEVLRWGRRQGFSGAHTRSYAAEGQLSLAPVTDWLRSEAVRPQLSRLDAMWLTEVARILPELTSEKPDLPPYEPITEYGQRQRFFEALARSVLTAAQPIILVIDDLQWCDRETIEWLHFLLRFDAHARMLIVGTARDESLPADHPLRAMLLHLRSTVAVTELSLEPLDAAESAKLAAHLEHRELDIAQAMRLFHETEGNPLFIVETVRARAGRTQPETLELPTKVQAVIESRLAQLSPPARELAHLAAAIGRGFTLDLLVKASHSDEDSVVRPLDELWQKRIVGEQSANRYDFTHDKLREGAYAEMSAPQRHLLHRRIAQALVELHADDLDPWSGQIAVHFEHAGLAEQAIEHYQRAALVAQRLYANEDAIALLSRALALLPQLLPSTRRDLQELKLQLALSTPFRITRGWASPEVERVLNRALELSRTVGDDAQRAHLFHGLDSLYFVQAKLEKVQQVWDELHRIYERMEGATPPVAEMMLASSHLHLGRIAKAREELERVLANDDPQQVKRIIEEQGWNARVHGRAFHAHALWLLGDPAAAKRRAAEAVHLARDLGQPFNGALAATYQATLMQWCADTTTAKSHAAAALALSTEYKAVYYRAWSTILLQHALASEQPGPQAVAALRTSIHEFTATGARARLPYYLWLLADACRFAGMIDEGLTTLEEALAQSDSSGERWWDAELHRQRGELLLARDQATDAESAFFRALEIARAQEARSLELRATTSLSRLPPSRPMPT